MDGDATAMPARADGESRQMPIATWDHFTLAPRSSHRSWLQDVLGGGHHPRSRPSTSARRANVFIAPVTAGDCFNTAAHHPYQGLDHFG